MGEEALELHQATTAIMFLTAVIKLGYILAAAPLCKSYIHVLSGFLSLHCYTAC